jgi:hypothetical protein
MDIVFGSVTKDDRMRAIQEAFETGPAGHHHKLGDASSEVDMEKYNTDIEHQEDVRTLGHKN